MKGRRFITKTIILMMICVLLSSLSYATCTGVMSNDPVFPGQTQSFVMSCDNKNEENEISTVTWTDELANVLHVDTGITPKKNIIFSETYKIPLGITTITATLTGTNLEGTDTANVEAVSIGQLSIIDIIGTSTPLVGRSGSMRFQVLDYLNTTVTNAHCSVSVSESVGGSPITTVQNSITSYDGSAFFSLPLVNTAFEENTEYLVSIFCSCVNNTDRTCFNNNLDALPYAVGSTSTVAPTSSWLSASNTLTDKSSYTLQDSIIYVCANVTNSNENRVPISINYNFRCGNSDSATDRVIINEYEEIRGISGNTTQNQCAELHILNLPSIQNKNNSCYAATDVCVLDEMGECYVTYPTTSAVFNLISDSSIENEEYLSIEDKNSNMLPVIVGLGILAVLLFIVGFSLSTRQTGTYKLEVNILGLMVVCASFMVMWLITWLTMEFSVGASYFGGLKGFFIAYSVVFGIVPVVLFLGGALASCGLMLGGFFIK